MVGAVFYAGFSAWDDEHDALTKANTQYSNLFHGISAPLRHISKETHDKIVAASDKYPKTPGIDLYIASSSDNDSGNYASEIYKALKDGHIPIKAASLGTQGEGELGIMLEIVDPDHPSAYASALISIFTEAELKFKIEKWDNEGWPPIPDCMIYVVSDVPLPH